MPDLLVELSRPMLLVGAATLLTACAQLPSNVSQTNRTTVNGATATFHQCGRTVRFAAEPRALPDAHLAPLASAFVGSYKWEVDALGLEQPRLTELAVCACRDAEYSAKELDQIAKARRSNPKVKFTQAFTEEHSRTSVFFEHGLDTPGFAQLVLASWPKVAPKCIFFQTVAYELGNVSALPTLIDTAKFPPLTSSSAASPSSAAAQRLSELDDLLRRGLITKSEHEQKRKAILDAL